MAYKLPDLPYAYDALEPHIDESIMKLHHDMHHKAYVDKLNEALKDYPTYQKYSPEILVTNWKKMPKAIQDAVRNNGGGDVNHTLFWNLMKEDGGGLPTGEIAKQINKDFGTFEKFKKKFNEAGANRFGLLVGFGSFISKTNYKWFLCQIKTAHLQMEIFRFLEMMCGNTHFYLQYKNKQDKYLEAWWNVVNWDTVNAQFHKAKLISTKKPIKNGIQKQYGI